MLGRELEKKEVQEGLIKACDVIDLIIEILRGSKNQKQVKDCLTIGAMMHVALVLDAAAACRGHAPA